MTLQLWDEVLPGPREAAGAIAIDGGGVTLRSLIRARVVREVERYNSSAGEAFQGLVQPEESERVLNGFRLRQTRVLDAEVQARRAFGSFEKNGFLVLVDDVQVTDLDAPLDLKDGSEVRFVKLVPLIGG